MDRAEDAEVQRKVGVLKALDPLAGGRAGRRYVC
jgi:hypothetical protein